MDVSVNYLAVLLAAASSMVVGSIWYAQGVFGKTWAKLAKVDMKKEMKSSDMTVMLATTFLISLVTAYVLAYVAFLSNNYFHNQFIQDTLTTAFFMWLGFNAVRFWTHDMFEGRPSKLTLLNVSNELTTLLVMALIIGAMGHPGI